MKPFTIITIIVVVIAFAITVSSKVTASTSSAVL